MYATAQIEIKVFPFAEMTNLTPVEATYGVPKTTVMLGLAHHSYTDPLLSLLCLLVLVRARKGLFWHDFSLASRSDS